MPYYNDKISIRKRIKELEKETIDGNIPTWYAYQEIDRLEQLNTVEKLFRFSPLLNIRNSIKEKR